MKKDKSTFTDNVSFFPVIDLSRPSILHQGLTLKNSIVNVEPLEGVLFSNQFGAEADRNVAVFRNQTNYITLQGNKINSNSTSDDSVVDLSLNPSGNVDITNDLSVSNITASGMNLTNNLSVSGETSFHNDLSLFNTNANISNVSGFTFYKATTDASNVFSAANNSGKLRFRSFGIDAYNTNDTSQQLFLNMNNSNAVRCNKLGIGANAVTDVLNVNGGNSNFSSTVRFNGSTTLNNEMLVWNNSKIYRRADANNSLNVIPSNEINFSLQSNRALDPTISSIALQLNDNPVGITMNRPTTINQTLTLLDDVTAEGSLNIQGEILFQHSSGIKETLNGSDYDLDIRNGDTDRAINFIIGTVGSRVKIDNPDADGLIFLSINGANICEVSSTGLHVNGTATETSDERLKENITEVSSKTCYDVVKYVKPKEFNFKGKEEREIGFIAQDIPNSKMPQHWSKMIMKDTDHEYLRLNYIKMNVVLWSAVQELMKEVDDLKKDIKKIKGKGKGD